jgi:hypothetical protein
MCEPLDQNLAAELQTLQAQLQWADASILSLVQAVELLNRSVHEFEATHPATTSAQVLLLLQQIRQSRPGPPPPAPLLPKRRRTRRRPNGT